MVVDTSNVPLYSKNFKDIIIQNEIHNVGKQNVQEQQPDSQQEKDNLEGRGQQEGEDSEIRLEGEAMTERTKSNIHFILNKFKTKQVLGFNERIKLGSDEVAYVCNEYLNYCKQENPLLELNFDNHAFAIIGDIHGQYSDIWRIVNEAFNYGKKHEKNIKYLFLGDYVDRGQNSLETILLLMCWKILEPTEVHLLRGNHECRAINCRYGFFDELKSRFQPEKISKQVFDFMNLCFDHMPIAAVLGGKYFAVHGGLSPQIKNVQDIKKLKYPLDGDANQVVNDLLWADPCFQSVDFERSPNRGPKFGVSAVDNFCKENSGITTILRAHQFIRTGISKEFRGKVITVFSAPNYRKTGSIGGVLMIRENELEPNSMIEDTIFINPL